MRKGNVWIWGRWKFGYKKFELDDCGERFRNLASISICINYTSEQSCILRWGKESVYLWRVYNLHYCVCDRMCRILSSRNLSGYREEIGEESDVAL